MEKGNATCAVSVPGMAAVTPLCFPGTRRGARETHVRVNAGEVQSGEPGDSAGVFAFLFPSTGICV